MASSSVSLQDMKSRKCQWAYTTSNPSISNKTTRRAQSIDKARGTALPAPDTYGKPAYSSRPRKNAAPAHGARPSPRTVTTGSNRVRGPVRRPFRVRMAVRAVPACCCTLLTETLLLNDLCPGGRHDLRRVAGVCHAPRAVASGFFTMPMNLAQTLSRAPKYHQNSHP